MTKQPPRKPDLRYGSLWHEQLNRYLGVEFDHADNDKLVRVVWLNSTEHSPWDIRNAIEARGYPPGKS